MAGNRLTPRLAALEGSGGSDGVDHFEWTIAQRGETPDEVCARYEKEHGPLPPRVGLLIWRPVQPGGIKPCA